MSRHASAPESMHTDEVESAANLQLAGYWQMPSPANSEVQHLSKGADRMQVHNCHMLQGGKLASCLCSPASTPIPDPNSRSRKCKK